MIYVFLKSQGYFIFKISKTPSPVGFLGAKQMMGPNPRDWSPMRHRERSERPESNKLAMSEPNGP